MRSRDETLDFRELIGTLPLGGRRLDPGDINAQRCAWGGVVTADGSEAEIAIPPIARKPGFVARLERSAVRAREALRRALPGGIDLIGYSTHLSLSMPAAINREACRQFLHTFAPGLMLLADRADSPGLLVRPRPGRMELAIEYVSGLHLQGVTAYAAGAAIATARALGPGSRMPLPPAVLGQYVPTADRFGWGASREAYGGDLLRTGRDTLLSRASGGTITAQDHLELSWAVARGALRGHTAPADLAAADRLVRRGAPLPSETLSLGGGDEAGGARMQSTPWGDILRPRLRPGFAISAQIATWDTTIFAIAGHWRRVFASVPRASLPRFLNALDRGALDDVLQRYLDAGGAGRALTSWSQATQAGLFDAIGRGNLLLAAELPPVGATSGEGTGDRAGKYDRPVTTPQRPWIWIFFALVLLGGAIAFGVTRGGTPPAPVTPGIATPAPAQAGGPRITHFVAVLVPPATNYTVEATDPLGRGLTYAWVASITCGTWVPSTSPGAVWLHPHPPCPEQPIHPGSITVTVTDAQGRSASHVYVGGSASTDVRP